MVIKEILLQWYILYIVVNLLVVLFKKALCQIDNLPKNYINQLLEKFEKRKEYSSFKDNIWGC